MFLSLLSLYSTLYIFILGDKTPSFLSSVQMAGAVSLATASWDSRGESMGGGMGMKSWGNGPPWDPPCSHPSRVHVQDEDLAATTETRQLPGNREENLGEEPAHTPTTPGPCPPASATHWEPRDAGLPRAEPLSTGGGSGAWALSRERDGTGQCLTLRHHTHHQHEATLCSPLALG